MLTQEQIDTLRAVANLDANANRPIVLRRSELLPLLDAAEHLDRAVGKLNEINAEWHKVNVSLRLDHRDFFLRIMRVLESDKVAP